MSGAAAENGETTGIGDSSSDATLAGTARRLAGQDGRSPRSARPRIGILVETFPVAHQTFIVDKFVYLLERGFDVELFCGELKPNNFRYYPSLAPGTAARRRIRLLGNGRHRLRGISAPSALLFHLLTHPTGTLRYLGRSWRRWGSRSIPRFQAFRRLVAFGPDVLHIEFGVDAPRYAALGRDLDCRTLVSFRGWALGGAPDVDRALFAPVWESIDHIHCLTEDLHRRALKRGCPPDLQTTVIPSSVDTAFFRRRDEPRGGPLGTAERPLRILSVGRLHWKKGYDYALPAIRFLLDRGLHLEYRIIGKGTHLPAVEYLIDDLSIEDRVKLLGVRTRDEVRTELEWCDIFLHAAVSEAFCNAVLEAQSMGVPVVTSDAGGLPWNLADGVTGFVVPRRDPHALAERIAELAGAPELRLRMGRAARARAVEEFDVRAVLARFEALYRQVSEG